MTCVRAVVNIEMLDSSYEHLSIRLFSQVLRPSVACVQAVVDHLRGLGLTGAAIGKLYTTCPGLFTLQIQVGGVSCIKCPRWLVYQIPRLNKSQH